MKKHFYIEPLEDRIAPALILNPYTVTFQNYETDSSGAQLAQGDTVVIKISKPLFTSPSAASHILEFTADPSSTTIISETFKGNSVAESLGEINLQGNGAAQGMNISVSVVPQAGIGQNSVSVGYIDAGNIANNVAVGDIELGSVYVQGNLGGISAGASFAATGVGAGFIASADAIQSLTVGSMSGASVIVGPVGKLNVKGNFTGTLDMIGYQFGSIGQLTIGGSLTSDSNGDADTGIVEFSGHIGTATIGNITGTTQNNTGELVGTAGGIGTLHITTQILGGAGNDSGAVLLTNGSIGKLIVGETALGQSITGGSGQFSGLIDAGIDIGKATVAGSITGGTAGMAASVSSTGAEVQGFSGVIEAPAIGSLTIGGSLVGGTPASTSLTADTSGAILVNSLGPVNIAGNITGNGGPNNGVITAFSSGTLATVYGNFIIAGNVTGSAGSSSGSILSDGALFGTIQSVHIAGDLTGSSGTQTGEILASTSVGTISIGGDLAGGSGQSSGEIFAGGGLGTLHITGNVIGGSGVDSGFVSVGGVLGTLYVGKNITGGSADSTGEIFASAGLTTATIEGSLLGNAGGTPISSATAVANAGYIQAGHIGTLTIAKNVTAGTNSAGDIANSGAIRSSTNIGSITIGGTVTGVAGNPVIISAQQGPGTSAHLTSDLAIGSITVKGAASYLDVLAGYGTFLAADSGTAALGNPIDGSAQIGTVTFDSTISATNLVAGANPDSNGMFGTSGDVAFLPRTGGFGILSSIANIVITGAASGDSTQGDSFGIVAESLGSIKVAGTAVPTGSLIPGTPSAVSGNLYLLEPLET